jgi:L-alanine-DL-glutamate epimerase-like enolase superfamily enzyme
MKITNIETVRVGEFPNIIWVRIYTDEGLTGLGETFLGAKAVEAYIHETVAPYLLGKDPLQIDHHWKKLYGYLGFRSSGVEMRGTSAVDIALWDIFGKVTNQPLCQLLGGKSRNSIKTYNTCAGYKYIRASKGQNYSNWGLPVGKGEGPYEDLDGFLNQADELAMSLLEQGITAMKIWPFDQMAEASDGQYISNADLKKGLEPFEKIRGAVGNEIDIMLECHSLWNLPTAIKISKALEEYNIFWIEDPIKMDSLANIGEFRNKTSIPVTASESLCTRWGYRDLLEHKAADIVMLDLSWCGGISEGKKIATMAESYSLPIAPHDCTGPVVLSSSTHLSINAPNALIQESVRAFYTGWYKELVTNLPKVENGMISPPDGPGHGLELVFDIEQRDDVVIIKS